MPQLALYIASTLGAVALFMMMPRQGFNPRKLGALLGAATLGGLWLYLARQPGVARFLDARMGYYYLFSALSLIAATRVITHTKPVYAALWFVLLMLSTAGMFLLLDAEFMAFALVIIYGGAILVTYVFVIMLAARAGIKTGVPDQPGAEYEAPYYDKVAREPLLACAAGFFLLSLLLTIASGPIEPNPSAKGPTDRQIIAGDATTQPILAHRTNGPPSANADAQPQLDNVEHIGIDLFRSHLLGIELAGVILLVSLIGAVVIARQKVENEDDAAQEAAPHG